MPDITDLFNNATETTRPDPAALTAQKLIGATSITVDTTAGWPTSTAVHFTMYQVDAAGAKIANTQTDWKGIVTSGTTIGTLTLKAGTDAVYPVGSKVICAPTGAWADDLATGLQVSHDQDGTLKAGAVDDATVLASNVVTTAKILDSNVTHAKLAAGIPVQMVAASYSAVATGTTTIPNDDTIPQNTEGTEFMSLAITPKSASNILVIEVNGHFAHSVATATMILGLFQDTTANAIGAISQVLSDTANAPSSISLRISFTAGTTSATTFKLRAGSSAAGTTTFNGGSGARLFGAIPKSSIVITEYKV